MTCCILVRYSPCECQVLAYTWKNQHGITFSSYALEEDSEHLIFELPHFHCTYAIFSILTFFKQTKIILSNTCTHTHTHTHTHTQNRNLTGYLSPFNMPSTKWFVVCKWTTIQQKNFNLHKKWLLKKIQWTDCLEFDFRSLIRPGRCNNW